MNPRRLAALAALCGALVLAGWVAAGLPRFHSPRTDTPAPLAGSRIIVATASAKPIDAPGPTAMDAVSIIEMPEAAFPALLPISRREIPPMQLASVSTPDPAQGPADRAASSIEITDECVVTEICIDRYLWSVYERAPKVDTIKVPERVKVKVKKKGKTRTVTKTVIKLVDEDFTWKDPKAAQKVGMPLMDYVIGGMDRGFKLRLYHALRAMDDAGLSPGITSGFRDDYRQSLASGNKAASDSSYHGGSRRGGYGHGLAADIVSVKGETRAQRWISSENLWKWIDTHGQEFGIGRPYLDRDAPHVGPIDGKEYADKRGRPNTARAEQPKESDRTAAERADPQTKERDGRDAKRAEPPTKERGRRDAKRAEPPAKERGRPDAKRAELPAKERGTPDAKRAELPAKKAHHSTTRDDRGKKKHAKTAKAKSTTRPASTETARRS
jgi:hypothetical protein